MAEVKYPKSWAALSIPQWRLELLATLEELADPIYQQKAWIEKTVDKDVIVGVGQVYHSLFEDLELDSNPKGAIGCFLFDEAELAALAPMIAVMGRVSDELGKPDDTAYVGHPLWPQVVAGAAGARASLAERGEPKT